MDRFLNKHIGPVCKLGPGGDFISIWPTELQQSSQIPANRLSRLLNTLSEIIDAVLGPESAPETTALDDCQQDKNRILTLFADDCATAAKTSQKPARRIRTYHRTAKKPIASDLPGQGSLFETTLQKARTA